MTSPRYRVTVTASFAVRSDCHSAGRGRPFVTPHLRSPALRAFRRLLPPQRRPTMSISMRFCSPSFKRSRSTRRSSPAVAMAARSAWLVNLHSEEEPLWCQRMQRGGPRRLHCRRSSFLPRWQSSQKSARCLAFHDAGGCCRQAIGQLLGKSRLSQPNCLRVSGASDGFMFFHCPAPGEELRLHATEGYLRPLAGFTV